MEDLETVQGTLLELIGQDNETQADQKEIKQLLVQVDELIENARDAESWFYQLANHLSHPYRLAIYICILCLIVGTPIGIYVYCKCKSTTYGKRFALVSSEGTVSCLILKVIWTNCGFWNQ